MKDSTDKLLSSPGAGGKSKKSKNSFRKKRAPHTKPATQVARPTVKANAATKRNAKKAVSRTNATNAKKKQANGKKTNSRSELKGPLKVASKAPALGTGKLRVIPIGGCEEVGRNMTVFEYGNDISSISLLRKIGSEEGLDYNALKEFPDKNENFGEVDGFNSLFQQYKIHGIPTLIFDKKFAISGAQDAIVLERMINISLESTKGGLS